MLLWYDLLVVIGPSNNVVRVQLLAKSLSGEEIACEIISVLSTSYGINSDRLLACMRDGAAANGVAVRTLSILYPNNYG